MKLIKILPIVFLATLTSVFASPIVDALDLINFVDVYNSAPHIWDTLLYVLFFGTLCVHLLKERLGNKASGIFGVILGLSLGIFLASVGKNISDYGMIAATAMILILSFLLFQVMRGLFRPQRTQDKWNRLAVFSVAYVIIYSVMQSSIPEYFDWLKSGSTASDTLFGMTQLLWGFCIIYLFIFLFILLGRGTNWRNVANTVRGGAPTPATPATPTPTPAPTPATSTDQDRFNQMHINLRGMNGQMRRHVQELNALKTAHAGDPRPIRVNQVVQFYARTRIRTLMHDIEQLIDDMRAMTGVTRAAATPDCNDYYNLRLELHTIQTAMLTP